MTPGISPDVLRARAEEVAGLLKVLSHPNRLLIACDLLDGERSVGEIETRTKVRQPGLSRELARLRDEGLVETRRESKAIFYRLADQRLPRLIEALCRTFAPALVHSPAPAAKPDPARAARKPALKLVAGEDAGAQAADAPRPGADGAEFAVVGGRRGRFRPRPLPPKST